MSTNDEVHPDDVGAATSQSGGTVPTDVPQSTVTENGTSGSAGAEHEANPDAAESAVARSTPTDTPEGAPAGIVGATATPNAEAAMPAAGGHAAETGDGGQNGAYAHADGVDGEAPLGAPYPTTATAPEQPATGQHPANPAGSGTASPPGTSDGAPGQPQASPAAAPPVHQPQPQPQSQQPVSNNQAWRSAERPVPSHPSDPNAANRSAGTQAAAGQLSQQGQPGRQGQQGPHGQQGTPPQGGQPGQANSRAAWSPRPDPTPPASPAARRRAGESPLADWQSSPPNAAGRRSPNAGQQQAGAAQGGGTPGGPAQGGAGQQGPPAQPPGGQAGLPDHTHWDEDPITEQARRMIPRYGLKGALYRLTKLNLGPSRRDLNELEIRERLNRQARRTRGYCGYIGIGSEKGGVGKTTLASLLAAEIAEGRKESVGIADLNPDLGTLPDRFGVRPHYSIRDLLAHVDEIPWRYHVHDFMEKVPEMNVRVLAASTDRKIRHQLSVSDVELLAELFAPFFSFAIFDNGTHITHEAMLGTLRTSHGLVLVTDNTRDGANLARKTLQFLTDNGYPEMRRRAVVAVVAKETASPIKVRAIEKAFRDHVRDLVIVPYDAALDGGGKIPFHDPNAVNKLLRKDTRMAVRRLAAIVMDDLVS